ncbi:MAG: hypothetical protein Q8L77_06320 [Nitrospirota bacterium]|nr:hypothetical protein [Nitrospirota bacterium]
MGKAGTKIVLESADAEANSFVVSISGEELGTSIYLDKKVFIDTQAEPIVVDGKPYSAVGYELELLTPKLATVLSGSSGMTAAFRLPCEGTARFVRDGTATLVRDVKFERFAEGGIWSSAVHSAKVSYPAHSFLEAVEVKGPLGVFFTGETVLRLERAQTNPETGLIDLQLSGEVKSFHTGTLEYDENHWVSAFQRFWDRPVLVAVLSAFGFLTLLLGPLVGAQWATLADDYKKAREHKLYKKP